MTTDMAERSVYAHTVTLKCESDSPAYDQRTRVIEVERETDAAWFGRPVDNPACPVLEWPRYAWREVTI